MSVREELLSLVEQVTCQVSVPTVRQIYIPEPSIAADQHAEFGLVELADGAAGLFYAWMGESQLGISDRYKIDDVVGANAVDIAQYYAGDDDIARSLGLAAINAIAQSVFNRLRVGSTRAEDSMGGLSLRPGDRLGMVGNFPSLVRQARSLDVPVTVVERKTHMLKEDHGIRITLNPETLGDCNKIICTAATLINDSVDEILGYCAHAEMVAMIGPSASFFPDPLFARGVDVVGGTRVLDASAVIAGQRKGEGLGTNAYRYSLSRERYAGTENLCAMLR